VGVAQRYIDQPDRSCHAVVTILVASPHRPPNGAMFSLAWWRGVPEAVNTSAK
jgi:hypothetical protein